MATPDSSKDESKTMEDVLDAALDELEDDGDDERNNNDKVLPTIHAAESNAMLSSSSSQKSPPSFSPPAVAAANQSPAEVKPKTKKSPKVKSNGPSQIPDPPPSPEMMEDMMKLEQMMKQLFQLPNGGIGNNGDDDNDDDDEQSRRMLHEMQQFMAHFESQANSPSSAAPESSSKPRQPQPSSSSDKVSEGDVSKTISSLLNDMAHSASHDNVDDDQDDHELPPVDEQQFLQGMMKELEGFASGLDADHVIDGMMEQLVSKDIMYEPLRQVTAKFPKWLAEHKETLPAKEYQERCQQFACFQKLVHVYETDPTNSKELMTLMQDVQEFGQPPAEIIHEIAPGLELDEHGVPKMDGMAGGLPFGGGNEECRIM